MGSTVGVQSSVQTLEVNVPMATTGSTVPPQPPAAISHIMESESLQSLQPGKVFKNNDKSTKKLPAEDNKDKMNENQEPMLTYVELERALKELTLSDSDSQSALKLFHNHPKLAKYMKETIGYVSSFKSQLVNFGERSLKFLDKGFHDLDTTGKTTVGEFLYHVKFCEKSYIHYMNILKATGLKHFSDSLFESEETDSYSNGILLWYIRSVWWNYSDGSAMFGAGLAKQDEVIQELIQNLTSLKGMDGKKLKHSVAFESSMGTLHNIARLTNSRQTFREMKLVDVLANFLNYEDQPKVTLIVLLVLAHIIDENQTHLLTSHDSVFDLMISLTKGAWALPDHRCDGFSAEELIQGMKGLSRNDTVKKVLVQKGILPLLLQVLTTGNEEEKFVSVSLLWELAFDPENKTKVKQDKAMMQAVLDLSKHSSKKIAEAALGVLWVTGIEKDKRSSAKMSKPMSSKKGTESEGHVMISYNWSDQMKLRKVSEVLRENGFKIWMDIDNIQGSTLQAMAEAVEQAAVILICFSEKYKESPNCRSVLLFSEAEYAFNLRKPIVPLLMQNNYKADGWLGILLGTKLYFDFSGKYSFQQKVNELMKEVGCRGKVTDDRIQDNPDGAVITREVTPLVGTPNANLSSRFNVTDWITENNLTKFVSLQSLSTEHLHFLKKLSSMAPEFYYSFILDFINGKRTEDDLTGLMMVTVAVEKIPR